MKYWIIVLIILAVANAAVAAIDRKSGRHWKFRAWLALAIVVVAAWNVVLL